MKVLLTGAAGFIGSHAARSLIQAGYQVHAIIRPSSNTSRISDIARQVEFLEADLFDEMAIRRIVNQIRPEACLHIAWTTEPGIYLESRENIRYLAASLHLASALADAGCKRFVGVGSCFEYDLSRGFLAENSPTQPGSLYAACKLGCAIALEHIGLKSEMQTAWARLFYLYGPGENSKRLVPAVANALIRGEHVPVSSGEAIRDFLHAKDAASALCAVLSSEITGPVNVGSGKPVSVGEIVENIGKILGRPDLIGWGERPNNPTDPPFVCANTRLLHENTSWKPVYGLEDGLQDIIARLTRNMERAA